MAGHSASGPVATGNQPDRVAVRMFRRGVSRDVDLVQGAFHSCRT